MGVFDMGGPTAQTDPTASKDFMPVFDALDADAQALVLANADPLDLNSMTAVTNAVDAMFALVGVVIGDLLMAHFLAAAVTGFFSKT